MSVLVVGCNHRSADLSLLERLSVPSEGLPKALASLLELEHVVEAVVLSTCNRVEIYANVTRFHPGLHEIRAWMADRADVHPQDLDDLHYAYYDDRAAAHLFAVAGGLDSMVVGERQIAGQVKHAFEVAREEGTARRILQRLFRQAVRVGRRLRAETDISRGASSIVDVALDAAARLCEAETDVAGVAGHDVVIVGAGKIGALTADRLRAVDARIAVWNRSDDKAARLAARIGGQVVPPTGLADAVARADLVVCTTGAGEPVVDRSLVGRAVEGRDAARHPLVLVDLAVPRNVDPACAELDGVAVIDLEHVRDVTDRSVTREVLSEARAIVDVEADRFHAWTRAIEVEPTIRAVRGRAEQVRRAELDRLRAKLSSLDERERETVDALTRGIVNTLLHEPTVRLKELADTGGAEAHANALRELFDLDD